MSNVAVDIASTIQSASIKRHPSPHHDLNPSTAASVKRPVSPATSISSGSSASTIPYNALKPSPRRANLPPLPDFRFEQSYLVSINRTDTWYGIAWITTRDQVMMPLAQGIFWNLGVLGWQYWNKGVSFQGKGLGTRLRRWWWGVNNWKIPDEIR